MNAAPARLYGMPVDLLKLCYLQGRMKGAHIWDSECVWCAGERGT